jgi:hypothetical protein
LYVHVMAYVEGYVLYLPLLSILSTLNISKA